MTRLIFLFLLIMNAKTYAQDPPKLEFFCTLKVTVEKALIVGQTPHGTRRIIPITGGKVEGPGIRGEIIPGGADWQVVRADGVAELEAHYQFKTDDGTIIYVKNIGIRAATPEVAAKIARGEKVEPSQYYFRTSPKFEAPSGKYEWVNNTLFICTGERLPDAVLITVFKVL
jgi:hypothetical protein